MLKKTTGTTRASVIVVAAAADQGDEEDADEDDGAGVPGVGTSVGLPGTVAGAGVVGTFVGAGDGLRVSVVAVTDDTERPGTPSASPAAVAKAGVERSDDRSLAYASEEAKPDDDSETDTAKEASHENVAKLRRSRRRREESSDVTW